MMKIVVLAMILTFSAIFAHAADETLQCRLYISGNLSADSRTMVELKKIELTLDAKRQAGFCVFPDGKVADKQWVDISKAVVDGSSGSSMGYSVYTMENGDSINAKFEGGWSAEGFSGLYTILGGTGGYEGATGDGSITGTPSPWQTSGIVDIVLNVSTP